MRLLLSACRRPDPLVLPGQVAFSRHPLYVSPLPVLSLISSPSTPLLPQAEPHALQLLSHIKGNSPSSSVLAVLRKEPVSLHCKTPVMGAIPQCLRDPNDIVALQVPAGLSFLMFTPHAACISLQAL